MPDDKGAQPAPPFAADPWRFIGMAVEAAREVGISAEAGLRFIAALSQRMTADAGGAVPQPPREQ